MRCDGCGALIPGWDCKHCPPTKEHTCPGCGTVTTVYNEAHLEEAKEDE